MPVMLYKCRFEFVVNGKRQFIENIHIVSHSAEGCEQFILDALNIRELQYREIVPITTIDGISSLVCQQITLQNAQKYLDSVEIAKGIDGDTFPNQQSVEDYRRKIDSIKYCYDMKQGLQPALGTKNIRIDPQSDLKPKYDDELQRKYSVWGIL